MGKATGFLEYDRMDAAASSPVSRIRHYHEFQEPLSIEDRRKQAGRCMDCGVPFCQSGIVLNGMVSGCPSGNLIPEWNDLLYAGNLEQAFMRLQKTNCFPEFTGRVCPALCEAACTCGLYGEPVTVRANEKSIIEYAFEKQYIKPQPPKQRTGKQVAVVGSGPSGLAAAFFLNRRGHQVTIYERSDRPGGLLMYGIPNMKLEKEVIMRRVEMMKEEGVCFITGADIGVTHDAKKLLKEYDAVILACGASNPRDLKVPGRDAKGIYFAVDFLKVTTKSLLDSNLQDGSYISAKDKHVIVIGGGDTGNDCVATAIRHGCKSVMQLEMMPELPKERTPDNAWPQWPRICKTDYGQQEAIECFQRDPRIYQSTIKEFVKDNEGNVCKIIAVKLASQKDTKTGQMRLEEIKGSEFEMPADLVLIAAGFLGSQEYVIKAFGVETDERSNVKTEVGQYESSKPKIFTAGDMHRGQSLVVWAIREGREVAREVDLKLMGYSNRI